jgi:Flp pilus assembly protein TadG
MKQHPGHRPTLRNLLQKLKRDERGAILIITTVYLPVIVGFFTLAVDMSYVLRTKNTLQVTADAAALAGIARMVELAETSPWTQTCQTAKDYATTNMPVASYGNVLKQNNVGNCSDVLVGKWNGSAFTSNATVACGITCNAVQVTTRMSGTNGNSLQLAFAPMIGISTFDVTATAVATYGNDPGATPWNVSIIQDVSGSFAQEINNAKAADQALETCILQNSSSNSKIGIGLFGVTATSYLTPLTVSTNNSALTNAITGISVGGNGMPSSGGTDIAAGINTGITQICPGTTCSPPPTAFKPALIIVSDGLPTAVNGSYCNSDSTCLNTAKTNAETAANAAKADGMDVFVVYFCNDGNNSCGSAANQTSEYLAGQWLSTKIATQSTDPNKQYFFNSPSGPDLARLMVTGVCAPQHKIRLVL